MKRCKLCGEEKPPTSFYRNQNSADGLRYECKDCGKRACNERRGSRPMPTLATRLAEAEHEGDCLIWKGRRNRGGYGTLGKKLAHRLVAEVAGIVLPPGYDLHHTCGNRGCVNLAHLTLVARADHGLLHGAEAHG